MRDTVDKEFDGRVLESAWFHEFIRQLQSSHRSLRVKRETTSIDSNNDGTIEKTHETLKFFDLKRRLIATADALQCGESPMQITRSQVRSLNRRGHVIAACDRSYDELGQLEQTIQSTHNYDDMGNRFLSTIATENSATSDRETTTRSYDGFGNLLIEVAQKESDTSNRIYSNVTSSYIYDAQGRLAVVNVQTDLSGDWTVNRGKTKSLFYDNDNRLRKIHIVEDFSGNGEIDSREVRQNKFDDRGRLTSTLVSRDYGAKQQPDQYEETTLRYGTDGSVEAQIDEIQDAQGRTDSRRSIFYFHKAGRLQRLVERSEVNNQQKPNRVDETTYQYALGGALLNTVTQHDLCGNGETHAITRRAYSQFELSRKGITQVEVSTG